MSAYGAMSAQAARVSVAIVFIEGSGGQEVYGIRYHHRVHGSRPEIELLDAHQQLALEIRRAQLARDELAVQHLPRGRDGQLHHDLALERGIVSQGAVVEHVDRALVAVEDELDVLYRSRSFPASSAANCPAAARPAAAVPAHDPFDHRGGATRESPATGVPAERRGVDSAARAARVRGDQRARRKPRALARADARTGTGADAWTRLDGFFELLRDRSAAQVR